MQAMERHEIRRDPFYSTRTMVVTKDLLDIWKTVIEALGALDAAIVQANGNRHLMDEVTRCSKAAEVLRGIQCKIEMQIARVTPRSAAAAAELCHVLQHHLTDKNAIR